MKIMIYSDSDINLDLQCIAANVSRLAPELTVATGKVSFRIKGFFVHSPSSYEQLSPAILRESKESDYVILFTKHPYDNNYFFEEVGNRAIISLSGWEQLTNIPPNNGAVFLICSMMMQVLGIGVRHDANTGCINDFWMDKTGIDLGMRSGSVCSKCLEDLHAHGNKANAGVLSQLQAILSDISAASRTDTDICDYWRTRATEEDFDVFLCHNSEDKDAMRGMNTRLKAANIITWFDEEQLPPGRLWQELLEEQIEQIKTTAVFVGESGLGPWQNMEVRAFLSEFIRRRCPVIPVILADCMNVPRLPLFLRQFTWVDFRKSTPDPFGHLVWGITGKKTLRAGPTR